MVANTYLEGTYTETYPRVTRDEDGLRRLFRQFSFPGGIPSHAAPETPGSINEGGELGYSLAHAYGAALDNPDLLVACVVGDGEAETGALATAWHSNKFLNPVTDGAVLPILHLNGYKIANPTVLDRIPDAELVKLFEGYGHTVYIVEGDDPAQVHQDMAATLDACCDEIAVAQRAWREDGSTERPRWPMIVLRTPKGWTGPREVDGVRVEGTFRAHQVPLAGLADNPDHLRLLEEWLAGYRPGELFDGQGRLRPEVAALAPAGTRRMSANPHANGGLLTRDLDLPDFHDYAVDVPRPGGTESEPARVMGTWLRDVVARNPETFRIMGPDETVSNRLGAVLDVTDRVWLGEIDRRRRPPGARRAGHGGAVRAPVPGLAGGLRAHRPPRPVQLLRGVRPHRRLDVQPARQVAQRDPPARLAGPGPVAQLPAVEPRVAPGPQRILPPGPRVPRRGGEQEGRGRAGLPAAGRQHAAVGGRPLPPQPRLHQRDRGREEPAAQLARHGRGRRPLPRRGGEWAWASSPSLAAGDRPPDVVMACCGDVPTLETLAAVDILRQRLPDVAVRVVNVVDLMRLQPSSEHPHGMTDAQFDALFTADRPVVFAFHGYPSLIHQLTYRRTNHHNIHVRGYKEEGTTTTPFDMVMLNDLDRFHLVMDVVERVASPGVPVGSVRDEMAARRREARDHTRAHGEDLPAVRAWAWPY